MLVPGKGGAMDPSTGWVYHHWDGIPVVLGSHDDGTITVRGTVAPHLHRPAVPAPAACDHAAALAEAQAAIDRLHGVIEGMTTLDPIFLSKIQDEMKIKVGVKPWATALIVESLGETLRDATNYVEMTCQHNGREIVVTLIRKDGKTPHEKRLEAEARVAGLREALDTPIPMILHCPRCHQQHIDVGAFATRPHRTHRCTAEAGNGPGCGHEWRPAPVRTVGVKELPDG